MRVRSVVVWGLLLVGFRAGAEEARPQYEHGEIRIPAAAVEEPRREQVSGQLAARYLEEGAQAWSGGRKCVSCHTNGIYMTIRPALSAQLGPPNAALRDFFVTTLKAKQASSRDDLRKSTNPAQVIYTAAGLAEWDVHVTKELSAETREALALVCEIQNEQGTWGALDCWPPYESDSFHLATVVAMAAATAPGWLDQATGPQAAAIERLRNYLKSETPPHDYGRVLLLWADARMPGLLTPADRQAAIDLIRKHQRDDGGWSLRTFAFPEAWGKGNRAAKLRGEPEFADPPSDGHQTGLAMIVLREAGVPASDPAIQRGVKWLQVNQRASGRWWTRSLNTDTYHFITYSGTAFPLLALAKADAWPLAQP